MHEVIKVLLGKNLSILRILTITWKVDLLMIGFCGITYMIDTYVFTSFALPIAYPALMGTAIAFLLGFNNNNAYNRWWEARIIWGDVVNSSRSLARNLIAYNLDHEVTHHIIYRHIAFLYALTAGLRGLIHDKTYIQHLSESDVKQISHAIHVPSGLLQLQAQELKSLRDTHKITDFEFLNINSILDTLSDCMGKSERINNTVFPINYIFFTKISIWVFIALVTMSLNSEVGLKSIILGWLIGFIFNVIHLNGLNLMNPFEYKPSGVPISSITRNIERELLTAIKVKTIPDTLIPINNEYIL